MIRPNLLVLLLPFLFSCSGRRLDADVSKIQVKEVKIDRLEQDVFNAPLADIGGLRKRLQAKYGNFYLGFQSVINSGGRQSSGGGVSEQELRFSDSVSLRLFVSDSAMKEAYKDCQKVYPDLGQVQSDLTEVFRHFRFYFPARPLPRVVSYMSGFNYSFLPVDSTIGIALELFLGRENKFYQLIQFPKFKTLTMSKEYLASEFSRGWMSTVFPRTDEKKDFLSEIIYDGKILYLVDALLPATNDTIKMGYSQKQLKWCRENEYNMWAYFVQKKIFYLSDPVEMVKYTGDGPFTSAFNKESPSRVGIWIGWQIIRSYMDHHPKETLEDLMNEKDAQAILSQSKYKPSR